MSCSNQNSCQSASTQFAICSFYEFYPLSQEKLGLLQTQLVELACALSVDGLVILAQEGINGTVSGLPQAISEFKQTLAKIFEETEFQFKNSVADKNPFKRFKVKLRSEIVTTRIEDSPEPEFNGYLTPTQWHAAMENEDDFILLDTRNWYETDLGLFQGAVDPRLKNFQEFPSYVASCGIEKGKKVLMYCTGGIRCEKAREVMREAGYQNVFHLQGGILKYLEEFPNKKFNGECFVFDGRVAVDQQLHPSMHYVFCPHCGQPGKEEITCENCSQQAKVCNSCLPLEFKHTCSKDCANQLMRKRTSCVG